MTQKTNQPNHPIPESTSPTFQDQLYDVLKVFWKAGYSYGVTGRDQDFYARVLEDFLNLGLEEFTKKYDH